MLGSETTLDGFPVGTCERCEQIVLTYPTWPHPGQEEHLCVHCDAPVAPEAGVSFAALEDLGYGFVDESKKLGKCADGGSCPVSADDGGGCGSGDCGSGGCGSGGDGGGGGGGCQSGGCGA